jgi:hypothetical protein
MPYKDPADRNYKQEWQNEKKRGTKALKAKLARQTARRALDKKGVSREGKDIDHKKPLANGGSNKPSNWRLTSPSANRSFKRKSDHTPK